MAINFTDSPANGATQVIGGRTYTYNSAKNKWDTTATEVVGPTATVYATVDNLPGSATTGDQAFVSGTNRLYIWNGSGWYNIALINTNPTISGVSSSYDLATDGTATVITITATDPEGLPITYSLLSDTSGNIATVTQGTGASSNVFTVTPSTNNANAGSFTLTFRASDGVNLATAPASFTLQFKVQNQRYTTALITSVGANLADNNDFVDSSTNSHTITAAGNATQNTFSPYRHGGYSTLLGSNTAYLRTPTDARYDIGGTGDWSYEAWVYVPTSHTFASYARAFGMGPYYIDSKSFGVFLSDTDSSGKMAAYWHDGSIGRKLTSTTAFDKGKWNHIAVCRTGNDIALYYNGTRIAHNSSYTASISTGNTYLFSGGTGNGTEGFNGYIRDVHFVNGSHGYDASSASLTVPTEKISAITNTKYLGSQEPYINDNSTHDVAITTNGNTTTEPFAPYDAQEYSASSHGGSMYFDGTGDFLRVTNDNTAMDLTTSGSWTLEAWYRLEATNEGNNIVQRGGGSGSAWSGTDGVVYTLQTNASAKMAWYWNTNGSNGAMAGATTMVVNRWYHIAISHNGTTTSMFINGVRDATSTPTYHQPSTRDIFNIGSACVGGSGASGYFNGSISQFRIVNGTAVYDPTQTTCTVPTSALTAVTNTSMLLNGTNAGIIDKSQSVKTITLNGNVSSSTTQTKYLSSSMYFDGAGDYITMTPSDLFAFRTGDFTIEGWAYITATGDRGLFQQGTSNFPASNSNSVALQITNASPANSEWAIYAGNAYHESTVNYVLNQWYHFAVVRASSVTKLYINGTEALSVSDSVDYTGTYFGVGSIYGAANAQCFTGYMSNLRITKGLARYTANFTPPTAALQG